MSAHSPSSSYERIVWGWCARSRQGSGISVSRVLLNASRPRFFREQAQALQLMYGTLDLSPPTYDLATLASRVMGASATECYPAQSATAAAARCSR